MTTEQIKLVKDLNEIKNKVQKCNDRELIIGFIMEAIKLAEPVLPRLVYFDGENGVPYHNGKSDSINLLNRDSKHLDLYTDIEDVHIQVCASLLMLMNKFANGIDEINHIINS